VCLYIGSTHYYLYSRASKHNVNTITSTNLNEAIPNYLIIKLKFRILAIGLKASNRLLLNKACSRIPILGEVIRRIFKVTLYRYKDCNMENQNCRAIADIEHANLKIQTVDRWLFFPENDLAHCCCILQLRTHQICSKH
jgi:hypothetical protein